MRRIICVFVLAVCLYGVVPGGMGGQHRRGGGQQPGGTMRMMTGQEAAGAGYYQYFKDRTPPHPGYYSYDTQGNVDEDWGPATATTATPGCRPSWLAPGAAR